MDNQHMTDNNTSGVQKLSLTDYNNIMMEIREQPAWRRNADIESDYYDGKQLDGETLAAMRDLGMAPIVENLTAPTIDAVLGLEAKTRLDWRVTSQDQEKFSEVSEALNQKLNEAEKEARADRANSDAFAAQVKSGLGWIEVGRESDPFMYPYRYEYVHRNEIYWDFKAKKQDLSDARYLVRRKWYDEKPLQLAFPDKKDLLRHVCSGWSGITDFAFTGGGENTGLAMDYHNEAFLTLEEQEWRDVYNKRLLLNEVWYRQWVQGYVIKKPDGSTVEFDKANKVHQEAVAYGIVQPRAAVFSKLRLSWWVGAHCLADIANPYKHGKLPYVPFFGKREDMTNVPYGMIRAIKPMQDEVNARNTKMVWLLSAKRITMTEGVTIDDEEMVRREAGRPDAMHILDPAKIAAGGQFKVESDFALNAQQYQSLVDKRAAIKNVVGVYSAFEGSAKDMSGVALNSLAEQSTQTLAEIYDNFSFARSLGGELLLSLIIEDMGEEETEVILDKEFEQPKRVILNHKVNEHDLSNDVQRAKLKVSLSDVPSTSSYRAQRLQMLTQITQSLPPNLQALVLDFVVGASDLPERAEIVERIRKATGQGGAPQPKNEAEAQAMQQQQAEAAEQQALLKKSAILDVAAKEAAVNKTNAETQKLQSEANANGNADLEKEQIKSNTALALADKKLAADANAMDKDAQIERLEWIINEMRNDKAQ
jgi:hypothetical protein